MKRWGECGTTHRYTRRPSFMSNTMIDEFNKSEMDAIRSRRRKRGLCEECGRAMNLGPVEGGKATLMCPCGGRATVSTRTQAYKNAVLLAGGKP